MKRKKVITIGIITFMVVALCIGTFSLLQWRASLNITRNQVNYDNGDIIYIPDKENLSFEKESCTLYYNNLLSVHLLSDLSEKEKKMLADLVNGQIVSDISGCINFMQIKVKETSLEELNRMADIINQSESVLYASYDTPMFMQPSAADNNPWSDNTSAPESNRGKEDTPNGSDWWAEAIGAYTAWEYVDSHEDELESVTVGVIDSGFFTEHEDLNNKITMLTENTVDTHGTAVAGVIAAINNSKGTRGVADRANLLCVDYDIYGENIIVADISWCIEQTKQLYESDCKVINNSFGFSLESENSYSNSDIKKFLKSLDDYSGANLKSYNEYLQCIENVAEANGIHLGLMIAELYVDAKKSDKDFLIVQSAGNGYDNNCTQGYDATYSCYYCDITEENFENTIVKFYPTIETMNERLNSLGVTYKDIRDHILIVGATRNQMDGNGNNLMCNWSCYGSQVDIVAPGEGLFVCGAFENGISKYNVDWNGTSFSAPMVSGAAALLWSIDQSLSAADARKLLFESGTKAVGVGEDAGTEYPMLNIGESVKKLTGWNNAANIQEGLYIVPGTQNILYVEQDEDEISFTAWWFKLASIEETAALNGSDAQFVCGEESIGQTSGKLHFEASKAILTLDENRFPYINEQTEYIWLRDSLWELSEEQLQQIGQELKVPADLNIEYTQDKAYYWEAGGRYATYVQIIYNDEVIATATVDSFTGELIKDIQMYSKS